MTLTTQNRGKSAKSTNNFPYFLTTGLLPIVRCSNERFAIPSSSVSSSMASPASPPFSVTHMMISCFWKTTSRINQTKRSQYIWGGQQLTPRHVLGCVQALNLCSIHFLFDQGVRISITPIKTIFPSSVYKPPKCLSCTGFRSISSSSWCKRHNSRTFSRIAFSLSWGDSPASLSS